MLNMAMSQIQHCIPLANIDNESKIRLSQPMTELIVHFPDTKNPIFEINQIIDNSNRSYLTGSKC